MGRRNLYRQFHLNIHHQNHPHRGRLEPSARRRPRPLATARLEKVEMVAVALVVEIRVEALEEAVMAGIVGLRSR